MTCPLSLELKQEVIQCPRNELEWNVRAEIFNCSSINQTCVDKTDMFQYHCVLNSNGTELLETCAPIKYIYGQTCAEFDAKGKIIQESSYNCSNATVPCPSVYNSADAFKYQSCYDEVQKKTKPIVTNDSAIRKIDSLEKSALCFASLALNVIMFAIFLMYFLMYFFYKRLNIFNCKSGEPNSSRKSSIEIQEPIRWSSFARSEKNDLINI